MNYGSDPADQIVRFSLDGTEMVLKLSGLAAKNFALFVYAVLNDQQKVRGKTKLVRMLKERRPFKFFRIPEDRMREFAREAKDHGLLYTAIRNKSRQGQIELVVFADDASKVNRILDNLNMDFVQAQAGEATVEHTAIRNKSRQGQIELVVFADDASKVNRILDNLNMDFVQAQAGEATVEQVPAVPGTEQPSAVPDKKPESAVEVETVTTEHGAVDFQVGNNEEEFNFSDTADAAKEQVPENFTSGREPADNAPAEKNPSEPSSPSNGSSSEASGGEKPSVKKELEEIRKEQASKKEEKAKPPQAQNESQVDGQRLSKEEYAAMKKAERENLWARVDAQAQAVFQDDAAMKGFLDFMARCTPQSTRNLLILYEQNPEITHPRTFDMWAEAGRSVRNGESGYAFFTESKYEREDGNRSEWRRSYGKTAAVQDDGYRKKHAGAGPLRQAEAGWC